MPEQKYAGYDSYEGTSIYKDDVERYIGQPEVLIGKNIHNLEYRNLIEEKRNKFKGLLYVSLAIIIIISIISLFLGQ